MFRVLVNKNVMLILKRNAGHSKWANIKHIKALKDSQRSQLFTRLSRQIIIAIQEGKSSDPIKNLKLMQVIEQAKRANMPAGTIQNTINSTLLRKNDCKQALIEIRGRNGLIILCEVFTNNYTRCKMNIASIIKKFNASFSDGAAGRHIFDQKGLIETTAITNGTEAEIIESATEHAIDSGAEDVRLITDDTLQFICEPNALYQVGNKLETFHYQIKSSSVEYIPKMCIELDEQEMEKVGNLYEKLENCEDVVKLYDNIG